GWTGRQFRGVCGHERRTEFFGGREPDAPADERAGRGMGRNRPGDPRFSKDDPGNQVFSEAGGGRAVWDDVGGWSRNVVARGGAATACGTIHGTCRSWRRIVAGRRRMQRDVVTGN